MTDLDPRDYTVKEMLVRLEGTVNTLSQKVDGLVTELRQDAHEVRKDVDDHEARIRILEARRTVTPLGLWSVVLGAIGGLAAIVGIISQLN